MIESPARDCALCPRLVAYRVANQAAYPNFFNGPVPSFGATSARFLVVGMAPGVKGANRTGRPFTGDHAGILLYETLIKYGFASGTYRAEPDDGVQLLDTRIINAVRCVPPANLPEPKEVTTCNHYLTAELRGLPNLKVAMALGVLAHAAVLKACGIPVSRFRFAHGAMHKLPDGMILANSYHVSRYNTNTRRLTTEMFETVIAGIKAELASPATVIAALRSQ